MRTKYKEMGMAIAEVIGNPVTGFAGQIRLKRGRKNLVETPRYDSPEIAMQDLDRLIEIYKNDSWATEAK